MVSLKPQGFSRQCRTTGTGTAGPCSLSLALQHPCEPSPSALPALLQQRVLWRGFPFKCDVPDCPEVPGAPELVDPKNLIRNL